MRTLPRTTAPAVVTALLSLLAITGCSQHPRLAVQEPVVPASSLRPPSDPGVDYRDPTTVRLRFAAAVYRHDTATDRGPQDSYRWAMAFATGELATALAAQPNHDDAQWSTWRAHNAATTSSVTAALVFDDKDQPGGGADDAYRAVRVVFTPTGTDGWRGPTEMHLVYCTLRHDEDGWRVEHYDLRDEGSSS